MQYLLTEEEMLAIRADRSDAQKLPGGSIGTHLEGLANVCKMVATTMIPTERTARQSEPFAALGRPYGCVHVDRPQGYCDRCPVAGICPLPKRWSK